MSFSTPALILIATAVFLIIGDQNAKVNAFAGVSKIGPRKQQQQQHRFQTQQRNEDALTLSSSFPCPAARTTSNRRSSLSARIYGVDGTVVDDDEFENKDTGALGGGNGDVIIESLKDAIGDRSVWTRIACAFASAPHDQLTPELVRNANLLRVGATGIDVAVTVPASMGSPSADQLVRVLVTVGYPQSWSFEESKGDDDDDEEQLRMLVQQIRILDGHATDRLSQRTAGIAAARDDPFYYEKRVVEQRWMERLQEEADDSDSLPDWWKTIAPRSSPPELVDECKLLKNLLNEDEFEDELRALFAKYSGAGVAVVRAAVSSIGSSGLYLKGRISSAAEEDEPSEILSAVAVPYVGGTIDKNRVELPTTNELREAVLVLVESVPPMPKPPAARETAKTAEEFTPFNEQVVAVVTEAEERAKTKPDVSDSDSEQEEDEKDDNVEAEPVGTAAKMDEPPMKEVEDEHDEDAPIPPTSTGRTYYQRKSPEEEAKQSEKYAAIEDLGERAYTILRDLNMI